MQQVGIVLMAVMVVLAATIVNDKTENVKLIMFVFVFGFDPWKGNFGGIEQSSQMQRNVVSIDGCIAYKSTTLRSLNDKLRLYFCVSGENGIGCSCCKQNNKNSHFQGGMV